MKQLTFNHIYQRGKLVFTNTLFDHYHDNVLTLLHDRNFISFKALPTVSQFRGAEKRLRTFQREFQQNDLRFTFPPNEKLPPELNTYLKNAHYHVGKHELYAINPTQFSATTRAFKFNIEPVTLGNFERYLALQYWQDFSYGTEFAKQKQMDYRQRFENQTFHQVLALYEDIPVGSVDVILTDNLAEIDNLFVDASYQRRGVGVALQTYVMETFSDHVILLIADGNDTAKYMYQKQNYDYCGYQYEAIKI